MTQRLPREGMACLLPEVSRKPGATQASLPNPRPLSDLLVGAVRCVVKEHMLLAELRSLALTDELTGLYNRRGFLALAEQQLKCAGRNERGLMLFFLDLDRLKQINDSFGHLEGDLALIHTAEILRETFRDSDIIARFGGDEFTVLAIEASDHSETSITTRLQENLRNHNERDLRYSLSLSMGVAQFNPKHSTSIGELMAEADQAMYEQKRRQPMTWIS